MEKKLERKRLRKSMKKKLRNDSVKIDYSFIKILTGSDLFERKVPLMSIKSANHGPVIWISAGVHGEEVGGIVVVQEIFKRLRKYLLKGAVYSMPLTNPMGFETSSRSITLSNEDLNRSFPGDKNGSLAERIAERIFTKIIKTNPELVLDLHNDWRESIPYVLIDPKIGSEKTYEKTYERTKQIASKTGFPVVLDTEEIEKTLTYSLLQRNIPAITIELGESYVVNEKDVENGLRAVWNVLESLGMVKNIEAHQDWELNNKVKDKILKYSSKPESQTSGILRFLVKPGDIVEKGKPIAKVYNSFGRLLETLNALDNALVLGYSDYSVAFPGAPVMVFGVV